MSTSAAKSPSLNSPSHTGARFNRAPVFLSALTLILVAQAFRPEAVAVAVAGPLSGELSALVARHFLFINSLSLVSPLSSRWSYAWYRYFPGNGVSHEKICD